MVVVGTENRITIHLCLVMIMLVKLSGQNVEEFTVKEVWSKSFGAK